MLRVVLSSGVHCRIRKHLPIMGQIGLTVLLHPNSHVDQQDINYARPDRSFSAPYGL